VSGPTLTEALRRAGYTHRRMPNTGRHEVVDSSGRVVLEGRAREMWSWLHGRVAPQPASLFGRVSDHFGYPGYRGRNPMPHDAKKPPPPPPPPPKRNR
jgi:hypothetical protein